MRSPVRWLLALGLLTLFAASAVFASDRYRVVRNVRLLTSPGGQRIKTLHPPETVTATGGKNGDYIRVKDTQDVGWAYSPYLELLQESDGGGTTPPIPSAPLIGGTMGSGPTDASAFAIAECPPEGDAVKASVKASNPLKNRLLAPPASVVNQIELSAILAHGDDTDRWDPNTGAEIEGYVEDVKWGGPETCNCHADDSTDYDTHIELSLGPPSVPTSQRMIVEVTPAWRRLMGSVGEDWNVAALKKVILHQRIRVRGWLFFDGEHLANATNTHKGSANIWRGTAWEIHPITALQLEPIP